VAETVKIPFDADSPADLIGALLAPPLVSPMLVSRPRLLDRLDEAALGPITILTGEPAAGKTSLVTDWVSSLEPDRPAAWLTVRPFMGDPITFFGYLLAALAPLGVDVDDLRLSLEDDEAPGDRWITALANRLAEVPGDPVIVVDDFHELESAEVLDAVETMLGRLPTNAHVVLVSRAQPPWRLSGWRMSGRVAEIDSVDLRFTLGEGRELVDSTGIGLDDDGVNKLLDRTEGWAGGLRLALLSMRRSSNPAEFVARFAADDEFVASYLFREVLDQQPIEIREFLLDVSILPDFTAAMCDRLRSRADGSQLIDRCRAESLFLTGLAGPGDSFHLHSLVAQLLRVTLAFEDPERLRRLHERASILFEEAGDVGAAISQATEAGDDTRVGELVSTHAGELAQQGRFDDIRSWLSLLRRNPSSRNSEVELGLAMTLAICGLTSEALVQVARIEAGGTTARMAYAARQARGTALFVAGRLDELVSVVRGLDVEVPNGDEALPFDPRCVTAYWGGVVALVGGDLDEARSALDFAVSLTDRADVLHVDAWGFRARVAHADGELREAERYADQCIRYNSEMGGGETSVLTCAYVALADVAWERDELALTEEMLSRAMRTTRPIVWEAVLVQMSASRLLASLGEIDLARAQLLECGQTYLRSETSPALRAMLCERAIDLALAAGDLDDAERWEGAFAASSDRPLAPALRIRLASAHRSTDLVTTVDRSLREKQALPAAIDTLLAAGAAMATRGDERRGMKLVARATQLAEPEGLVRRFLDAGSVVEFMLRKVRTAQPVADVTPSASPFFLDRLISSDRSGAPDTRPTLPQDLAGLEPLTLREVQVLELLVARRSYSEIGIELFVSRNTVKSHVSHIYTKLGVSGRARAAETARQLGIL